MTRTSLILIIGLFMAVLSTRPAGAMPAGEDLEKSPDEKADFFEHVVESRRTAGERYQTMREERLKKLNRSAAAGAGRSSQVPGWKLENQPAAPVKEDPTDSKGLYILLLVGAGVVTSLALRILAPFLFHRVPKTARAGEPMTVTLKPRKERKLHRA